MKRRRRRNERSLSLKMMSLKRLNKQNAQRSDIYYQNRMFVQKKLYGYNLFPEDSKHQSPIKNVSYDTSLELSKGTEGSADEMMQLPKLSHTGSRVRIERHYVNKTELAAIERAK
jgi:hypothetical protein